jgi:hypothetical protein
MKITSLLALSALMTVGANAQVLFEKLFTNNTGLTVADITVSNFAANTDGKDIVAFGVTHTKGTTLQTLQVQGTSTIAGTNRFAYVETTTGQPTPSTTAATLAFTFTITAGSTQATTINGFRWLHFNQDNKMNVAFYEIGSTGNTAISTFDEYINASTSINHELLASSVVIAAGTTKTFGIAISQTKGGTIETGVSFSRGFQVLGVPEPSTALLGAFGVLALLRRRRA